MRQSCITVFFVPSRVHKVLEFHVRKILTIDHLEYYWCDGATGSNAIKTFESIRWDVQIFRSIGKAVGKNRSNFQCFASEFVKCFAFLISDWILIYRNTCHCHRSTVKWLMRIHRSNFHMPNVCCMLCTHWENSFQSFSHFQVSQTNSKNFGHVYNILPEALKGKFWFLFLLL